MKFGRYLSENLTPEWKRAYIDYRACKKAIKVISQRLGDVKVQHGQDDEAGERDSSDGDDDAGPSAPPRKTTSPTTFNRAGGSVRSAGSSRGKIGTPGLKRNSSRATSASGYGATATSPRPIGRNPPIPPPLDLGESSYTDDSTRVNNLNPTAKGESSIKTPLDATVEERQDKISDGSNGSHGSHGSHGSQGSNGSKPSDGHDESDSAQPLTNPTPNRIKASPKVVKSPRFADNPISPRFGLSHSPVQPSPRSAQSPQIGRRSLRSLTLRSPGLKSPGIRSARTFEELYDSLEDDEQAFFDLLERELDKVERFYHDREAEVQRKGHELRDQLRELAEHRKIFHELYPNGLPEWEAKMGRIIPLPGSSATGIAEVTKRLRQRLPFTQDPESSVQNGGPNPEIQDPGMDEAKKQKLKDAMSGDGDHQTYNPERYQKYKKDLRKAVLEYYRQLELVKNYRILNLTGFRKALKKCEKTTRIHCMEMYTDDKISKESFAQGEVIDRLLKQTEELYTEHFEHGDSKKARDRLRRQFHEKTHYQSVFRSGIFLGLGGPAAIFALVKACEDETRRLIPPWQGLLQIYGGFYLAVIFALLFQLNLEAFISARINYEFVMELSRPTIDYRSFLELPSFFFMTLSYCFFFTFYRVGASNVDPTTWPLAWLVFVIAFFINPIDIFRRGPRYWFLRVLFRVCTPGYSRVEFIAFFLADELNSLMYTIQNFYFIGCTYAHHWPGDIYTACPSGQSWPYGLLLSLPALARLVQCLKRYHDSRLSIHLINAGKYLSTILQLSLFVLWRSRGRSLHDASLITWAIFATASSIYNSGWDLVVDWSLFRPDSGLLRQDRGYSSRYVYYFAMVTDVLLRFIWVWYLPDSKSHTQMRSFFFALAEMLRRWQWNFFRVETEHLGNADAYRVTREIPLPYRRVDRDTDEDEDEKEASRRRARSKPKTISVHLDRIKRDLVGQERGRGPDELNVGPRGRAAQREYEARRPSDTLRSDESEV